jgi:hypothetical protein
MVAWASANAGLCDSILLGMGVVMVEISEVVANKLEHPHSIKTMKVIIKLAVRRCLVIFISIFAD